MHKDATRRLDIRECAAGDAYFKNAAVERRFGSVALLVRELPAPGPIAMIGLRSVASAAVEMSGPSAELPVSTRGVVAVLQVAVANPVVVVVHPAGRAGATTPSKFSVKDGVVVGDPTCNGTVTLACHCHS